MIEVEIKAPLSEREAVMSKLIEHGCTYLGHRIQSDTYYNAQDRDFAKTDEALRIRKDGECHLITYKGPKVGTISKSRKEVELEISSPEVADELLTCLGYSKVMNINKTRDNYRLDQYTISLDNVRGLGDYIEIETAAQTEGEVPHKVENMIALFTSMGLTKDILITKSYLELLKEKSSEGLD
ncbi:MAG: class IV adenylate cyclase [ANME-2 cluster archaeon]|nr:class IV adenylate cyclase [ANME-2 cluster archaeon]